MGERTVMQESLFYGFSLEDHVPADHLLRSIDRFVDLSGIREHLRAFYSVTGRPSIDPALMIRMLIVGYGDAANLAWLVHERGIKPHIPVFEKSRSDGSFGRPDFIYDHEADSYSKGHRWLTRQSGHS